MQPLVRTFSPSQTIFQNLDVETNLIFQLKAEKSLLYAGKTLVLHHSFTTHVFSVPDEQETDETDRK